MQDGNAFLAGFVERYNAKFATAPAKPDNLHRALNIELDRLAEVFCLRDKRYVTKGIFDPHQQRVTHAAITENTHLSAVLAHIKVEQEKSAPPPKVKPVSAKNGYKKTGRRPPGRPSKMEAYYERRRAERAAEAKAAETTSGTSKALHPLE